MISCKHYAKTYDTVRTNESDIYKRLRNIFKPHEETWEILYAYNTKSAMNILENKIIDLIIADTHLPNNEALSPHVYLFLECPLRSGYQ